MRESMRFGLSKSVENESKKESLQISNKESVDDRNELLKKMKSAFLEFFGTEKIPEDLIRDFMEVKRQIKEEVDAREYLEDIDEFNESIQLLILKISQYRDIKHGTIDIDKLTNSELTEDGNLRFEFDGEIAGELILGELEKELFDDLQKYFDACRIAYNASRFKHNVGVARDSIIEDNKSGRLNFYDKNEKRSEVIKRLEKKYKEMGLSRDELDELIKFSDLEGLEALDVNSIGLRDGIKKIKEIFNRFSLGDKSKYIALSTALLIPAYFQGVAPDYLAEAFKGASIDVVQVSLYGLMSAGALGSSLAIEKFFKDFLNQSFSKEGGIGEEIATNLAEFPAEKTKEFGPETVKDRIAKAKDSYNGLLRTVSFNIAPAAVTTVVASCNLWDRSPWLAAGTAGSGLLMTLADKYIYRRLGVWKKEREADETREEVKKKIEEQLSAHMEVVLAGEKDKFAERIKELMAEERLASSSKNFLRTISDKYYRLASVVNMAIMGAVASLIGAGHDKFISGLVYSNILTQNVEDLFRSKMDILYSIRNIEEMEIMFNGYAAEEQEKEKDRIGVDEIESNDINLSGVSVKMGKAEILKDVDLNIPAGSMVRLGGKSGAGKTTLMKVITGYYKPSKGQVSLGEVDIERIKKSGDNSIYGRVAYLSQYPYVFDDSLKNNLTFGIKQPVDRQKIQEVLREVGLDKRFRNINEKLLAARGDLGSSSGGETSRIGLARILLKIRNSDTRLVFLDEPSASVDNETKMLLVELIKKEKEKKPEMTFIIISHDEEFIQMLGCDMEVNIKDGEVIVK